MLGPIHISNQLFLAIIDRELEYAVVHSVKDFIFVRVIPGSQPNGYRGFVSGIVPLTNSTTPIMPLIFALLLHARKDGQALKYKATESFALVSRSIKREWSVEEAVGTGSSRMALERHNSAIGLNLPIGNQFDSAASASVLEYWEPCEVALETPAGLLKTVSRSIKSAGSLN